MSVDLNLAFLRLSHSYECTIAYTHTHPNDLPFHKMHATYATRSCHLSCATERNGTRNADEWATDSRTSRTNETARRALDTTIIATTAAAGWWCCSPPHSPFPCLGRHICFVFLGSSGTVSVCHAPDSGLHLHRGLSSVSIAIPRARFFCSLESIILEFCL